MQTRVDELYIYPIKSFPGVSVSHLSFDARGVVGDREFMLVDDKNRFVTQRTHPKLALYKIDPDDGGWLVTSPKGDQVQVARNPSPKAPFETQVWKDSVTVFEVSEALSAWFSRELDMSVRLVQMDLTAQRIKARSNLSGPVAFADGYPLLICNQTSLAALHADFPGLEMRRFRANVVITLPEKNMEYDVSRLETTSGHLALAKPCVRCNIPAIDPDTAEFDSSLHQRLRKVLTRPEGVVFGQNAFAVNLKQLTVGDALTIAKAVETSE